MLALVYLVMVTGLSIGITLHFSTEVTWFTYFIGGVAGLLVGALGLDIWNRKKRNRDELFPIHYEI